VSPQPSRGLNVLYCYNTYYDSATQTGIPNALGGFSLGDAMLAMARVAAATMPEGYKYEWTDSSYEERKSGNMTPIALGLSVVFTFLFLAVLY
jgi:multidrug efflux pump subunit AcrB